MQTKIIFRIIYDNRENYKVIDKEQNIYPAQLAGKIRQGEGLWPTVGDWVHGVPQPGEWVQITEVLDRKSVLSRKDPAGNKDQVLAANVDTFFIVTSANHDLNLNRLDRYITIAKGEVRPVILINKIELADDPAAILDKVSERFPSVDISGVSAHEGLNLTCFENYVSPNQTVAFVGSSGVGKSTLINYLLGGEKLRTQEIRESDSRGRHTTTSRELYITAQSVAVIDTPGIRQVGLSDDTDLSESFGGIEALSEKCRFGNCQHKTEPGCAIKEALETGELEHEQWESYLKLGRELAFLQRKTDKALQSQEKKRWAKLS